MRAFVGRFFVALLVVVLVTVVAVGGAYRIAAGKVSKVATVKIDPVLLEPGNNFLFVGSDTRAFVHSKQDVQHFGSPTEETGQRSDTIMVAHIDPRTGVGTLVSFPRDLWVAIPGMGHAKINAAFNAGPQRVMQTIEQDFDVPISHYLEVDFEGFRSLVNALGTIPIYFPTPARDAKTGLSISSAGCKQLNGDQALAYVRSRYYESYVNGRWRSDPTSDLGRIQRQQYFMRTLALQAVHASERSPWRAMSILDRMLASLQRDQKLGLGPLRALAYAFSGNAGPLATVTLPTNRQFINGQDALVLDSVKAAPILDQLRGADDGTKPTAASRVAPSSVAVTVRNGTTHSGLAATASDALHARGFVVAAKASNADRSDYSVTEVRYAPGAQDKARLVLAQLGGAGKLVAVSSATGNADVVVVIGADFSGVRAPATVTPAPTRKGVATTATTPAAAAPPNAGC